MLGDRDSRNGFSGEEDNQRTRSQTLLITKRTKFLDHTDPRFWNGRAYSGPDHRPEIAWECNDPPRDDHDSPGWLKASEYQDRADAFQAKCEQLAQLMQLSKKTVLYTGAGISASVVGQAARGGANEQGWKAGGGRCANPTPTHFLLGHLGRAGFIHEWIQQNHDGLPQKAGFPQEKINEVHGSWFDPSNPVVKYGGFLRDAECRWMQDAANTADLVIVLGTSLGGLNADQVATNAAQRSLRGESLGTVCINLQQTPQDGKMTLRIFGESDKVMSQVCKFLKHDLVRNLGLEDGQKLSLRPPAWTADIRMLVPYDADGHRVERTEPWMWLDLGIGKQVKITDQNNIQGCKQLAYKHIGNNELTYNVQRQDIVFSPGDMGMDINKSGLVVAVRKGLAQQKGVQRHWIMRKIMEDVTEGSDNLEQAQLLATMAASAIEADAKPSKSGLQDGVSKNFSPALLRRLALSGTADYTAVFDVPRHAAPLTGLVSKRDCDACCFDLDMSGATMHLGIWWLEAAARGALEMLPVTNVEPDFAPAPAAEASRA